MNALDPPDEHIAHDLAHGEMEWRMTRKGRYYLACLKCNVLAMDAERRFADPGYTGVFA